MLSIQPIDCIKELLQMAVGPPVSTNCPFTFSYFQLFITLSRNRLFFAKYLMQLGISLHSKRTSPPLPRQAPEMYCFAHVEEVWNSTHFVEKSYCFQNTKAWEWDLAHTITVKHVLFGIATNTVPNLARPWWKVITVHAGPRDPCLKVQG